MAPAPVAYFFGEPHDSPVPGPAVFPICFNCHTPFVLRRTQGFHEPHKTVVEWRFFADCECRPMRYKAIDERKDTSHGAQTVQGLVKEEGRWKVEAMAAQAAQGAKKAKRARQPKEGCQR